MLRSIFRLILLSAAVPFTILVLSVAFIYTGIVRRGIWMVVNVFVGVIIAIIPLFPMKDGHSSIDGPKTSALFIVAIITFFTIFYQKVVPLPYTHYLQYLNSIEYQILGYDDLTYDSGDYQVLNQPKATLYKKNFEHGSTSTVIPFWDIGQSEAELHHVEKTNYFFFVEQLKWASNLMLLPKFVYAVMLLYAVWLTLFSRAFDVFLYRVML
ncbi:hypothetical protein KW429_11065 [Vibrio fluvialis]|nr:hypothetical protein [Vibrio fluvialis]MBY7902392.1 hypothetical protein [Vibrio fluvialis]